MQTLAGITHKDGADGAGLSASDQNKATTLLNVKRWGAVEYMSARTLCRRYRKQLRRFGFEWERKS